MNIDIACGFALLFSMLQPSHSAKIKISDTKELQGFVIDTPISDSLITPYEAQKKALEYKVSKGLEETSRRINRLKQRKLKDCDTVITVVIDTPLIVIKKRKVTWFERTFKIR